MAKYIIITFSLLYSYSCISQSGHTNLLSGDEYYLAQEYNLAEEQYRKAREEDKEIKSTFNLGNTVYLQERYEEAVDHFETATALAESNLDRSNAYYNLGNALFQNQKFEEAIDAFKEAIVLNPDNKEAKYNLLVTKQILKQAQQQEQQQQQNQDQQEQQDQEQQENQEQQDQQQSEDQQNQDGQEQEQEEETEQEENPQDSTDQDQDMSEGASFDSSRLDKQALDSLDAMKLLQIIENEEQKVQEKLKKFNSGRKKTDKDW